VTCSRPGGEQQKDPGAGLGRDRVALGRLEPDEGSGPELCGLLGGCHLDGAVDDQYPSVLVHLVLAELLPRLENHENGSSTVVLVHDDGVARPLWRVDREQVPLLHELTVVACLRRALVRGATLRGTQTWVSFQSLPARSDAEPLDRDPAARSGGGQESEKQRTDRQLIELLNELRVALPGAQVLLGFLLTVPFATRFGQVEHRDRVALFVCLLFTAVGTVLLMAPSVYHRLRWEQGGKKDVVRVAHVMFLVGTASLAVGIAVALFLVADVLFGTIAAAVAGGVVAVVVILSWYVTPLVRGREARIRHEE